ncbi:hypothetical protein ACWCQQ_47215 [Streptomyces sp. NPDC002143]
MARTWATSDHLRSPDQGRARAFALAADKLAQEDLSDVGILQLAGALAPVVLFASDPDLSSPGGQPRMAVRKSW